MRGRGLLLAMVLPEPRAEEVVRQAREEGSLPNAPRPTLLRFMPALTVTAREIATMLRQLGDVMARVL